jgi:hypothetical protein
MILFIFFRLIDIYKEKNRQTVSSFLPQTQVCIRDLGLYFLGLAVLYIKKASKIFRSFVWAEKLFSYCL